MNMIRSEIEASHQHSISVYYLLAANSPKSFSLDENGQCHDYEYQLFDQNRNIICYLNDYILLRSSCAEIQKPLEYIESIGSKVLLSWKDECVVANWYKHVSQKFTKRNILEIGKAQLSVILLSKFSRRNKVFIKSKSKNFGIVTDTNLSHFDVANSIAALPGNEILILAEPLDLCSDEHGLVEYRIWITHHQITSISRYIDIKTQYKIPMKINDFAQEFIAEHKHIFPAHYILDVGIDYNLGFVVIELNGMISSGRYYRNDFNDCLKALLNQQEL